MQALHPHRRNKNWYCNAFKGKPKGDAQKKMDDVKADGSRGQV